MTQSKNGDFGVRWKVNDDSVGGIGLKWWSKIPSVYWQEKIQVESLVVLGQMTNKNIPSVWFLQKPTNQKPKMKNFNNCF